MKRFFSFLLATASILLGQQAFAEGQTVFTGSGVNLMSLRDRPVALAEESILIQQIDGGWRIESSYLFQNTSDQPTSMLYGFPFKQSPIAGDDTIATIQQQMPREIKVTVRDQPAKLGRLGLFRKKQAEDPEANPYGKGFYYSTAFTQTVSLEPKEQVKIVQSYEIGQNLQADQSQWLEYNLFPSKPWAGDKIGKLKIEIRFKEDVLFCDEIPQSLISEGRFGKSFPCSAPTATAIPVAINKMLQGGERKLIWEATDVGVMKPIKIAFAPRQLFWGSIDLEQASSAAAPESLKSASCETLRLQRNGFYAFLGYPFTSGDLKTHFEKQPWYKADPGFDPKKLTQPQKNWLNAMVKPIIAVEKEKGCKQ